MFKELTIMTAVILGLYALMYVECYVLLLLQ